MREDKFFKFSFFFTVFLMVVVFTSNIERASFSSFHKETGEKIVFEKVDVDKIKKLIAEDKLSDKNSLFYKIIDDTNSIPKSQH